MEKTRYHIDPKEEYEKCIGFFVMTRSREISDIIKTKKRFNELLKTSYRFGYIPRSSSSPDIKIVGAFLSSLQGEKEKPIFDVKYEDGEPVAIRHKAEIIVDDFGHIFELPEKPFVSYDKIRDFFKQYLSKRIG